MYSSLLFFAIAFSSYGSAQSLAGCEAPCTEVANQHEQKCMQYYDEQQQTIDVRYYECVCSLRQLYVDCYTCVYDQTNYDEWLAAFEQSCNSLAENTDTAIVIFPSETYFPSETITEADFTTAEPSSTTAEEDTTEPTTEASTETSEETSTDDISMPATSEEASAVASSTPSSSARSTAVRSSLITSTTANEAQTPIASATAQATTSGGVGSSSPSWWLVLGSFLLLFTI
ncbi:hypothetical protein POJ06DRAFT_246370 [Lipomyces tetrasporus]|uniref:Extracellular membrane protein CFEM domain-containing protein n=1 Tax=Lipomyces tetrasporus TaxID=54092 RepID=A0AAD7VVI5_9ASCO|nr:uncharacterized protein POJ06DRAFT_246370 [Lipomyces tetrasporus]KAJ8103031.1 hypothetical protein POJ06DRAFT_246370 [Lipomyces tetrasporus]